MPSFLRNQLLFGLELHPKSARSIKLNLHKTGKREEGRKGRISASLTMILPTMQGSCNRSELKCWQCVTVGNHLWGGGEKRNRALEKWRCTNVSKDGRKLFPLPVNANYLTCKVNHSLYCPSSKLSQSVAIMSKLPANRQHVL